MKRVFIFLRFLAVVCVFLESNMPHGGYAQVTVPLAAPMYTIKDLGTLGGTYIRGNAINNQGQVAGTYRGSSQLRGFFWNGTTMVDIGDLGGGQTIATGINNSGQITGYSTAANGTAHPFIWNGTNLQDLGVSTFFDGNGLAGINDLGQVTGYFVIPGTINPHAFFWNGTTLQDIVGPSGPVSNGTSINNSGQITGVATLSTLTEQIPKLFFGMAALW